MLFTSASLVLSGLQLMSQASLVLSAIRRDRRYGVLVLCTSASLQNASISGKDHDMYERRHVLPSTTIKLSLHFKVQQARYMYTQLLQSGL